MTEKKAYTVTDLGGGDGGKGGVVHKLCTLRKPHTVIKVGGAQGQHGVTTARGEKFAFSTFGCGTFNGARTFVSDRFVVSPLGLMNEARELRYEHGLHDPFALMAVDGNALCTTPFHGIASRLKELARMENPRGTVGVGIGEAYLDAERFPDLAIRMRDLKRPGLREKVYAAHTQKLHDLAHVFEMGFLSNDAELVKEQIDLLRNGELLKITLRVLEECGTHVDIVDDDYLSREVLSRDGIVVIESSHGILTDRFYGFHPHTTRLRTLPEITSWSLLKECEYDGEVVKLGVTRAYQIRHGAGPLVVDDPKMAEELLPDEVCRPDRYRGKVRIGPLDTVMLRYALNVCGGPETFDGIAVTWFDYVARLGSWKVCDRYEGSIDPTYFTQKGDIRVHHGDNNDHLWHQEALNRALSRCSPHVVEYPVHTGTTQGEQVELCSSVLKEQLGVPVRMIAFGPTENDKVIF